jgi:hypothetical protein
MYINLVIITVSRLFNICCLSSDETDIELTFGAESFSINLKLHFFDMHRTRKHFQLIKSFWDDTSRSRWALRRLEWSVPVGLSSWVIAIFGLQQAICEKSNVGILSTKRPLSNCNVPKVSAKIVEITDSQKSTYSEKSVSFLKISYLRKKASILAEALGTLQLLCDLFLDNIRVFTHSSL